MSDIADELCAFEGSEALANGDFSVCCRGAAEITRLRAEQGEVRGYLSRLLQSLHPSIEILPDLLGVCTQIDNVLAGQMEDITRLRAAINNALLEPWLDGQLGGTWQQNPIGPNETPEEAVKRLVSVRAHWEVYKNNCENPEIAELRAELATARREAEQERDEFFNRLGRITEYMDIPVDATAQRIIEAIQERIDNEREACASVEVRLTVPEGAETWTPLEAWEEALLAFDEAFRDTIRAAAKEGKP